MNKLKKVLSWSIPKANKDIGDYTKKEGSYYLVGMFGQNLIYAVMNAALSLFYTDVLLVPIATIGIIFTIARVWDAINDPIMGVLVDKTHSKWGKCRPYLKYMPIPVGIITLLLFLPISNWPMGGIIAYLVFMYFLWSPVYTLCDIPLWSLPSLMIPQENKRTKLISAAKVVGTLAGTMTAIYAPIKNAIGKIDLGLFPNVGMPNYDGYFSQEQGYLFTTFIVLLVGVLMFKFVFPNTRERVKVTNQSAVGFKSSAKLVRKNKPFLYLVISGILGSTKLLLLTAGLYFCKWALGNGDEGFWIVFLGAPFIVGQIIALIMTPKAAEKIGKKKLYIGSSYLSAIPTLILFIFGMGMLNNLHDPGVLAFMIIMLLAYGFLSGFSVALQPVMIADTVDYLEWKEGTRADGVFFSGLTFLAKLTSGIAILIANVLLGFVKYTEVIEKLTADMKAAIAVGGHYELDFAASYPQITLMMFILISLIPAIGCVLQGVVMHKYKLTDKFMDKVRKENTENRKLAEEKE